MSCTGRDDLVDLLHRSPGGDPEELMRHVDRCEACRGSLDAMRETWSLLGAMEEAPSSDGMRSRFLEMLADERTPQAPGPFMAARWAARPVYQLAALAAALVIGAFLGSRVGSGDQREAIEELRAEMKSVTSAVTLGLLNHQSSSERLRAVGLCEASPADGAVIEALLTVINEDPSVNVRLAALDVLAGWPGRPGVRDGLLESFPRQEAPPMQAAMADVLLAIDGERSVSAVREAAGSERTPAPVREYLIEALRRNERKGQGT